LELKNKDMKLVKEDKKSIEDYIMIGVGVAVLTITVVGITLGIIYN
jgi:hypothetical protein